MLVDFLDFFSCEFLVAELFWIQALGNWDFTEFDKVLQSFL